MEAVLTVGIIIFVGFIFGELATKVKLPKVTGYILAGVFLDPDLSYIITKDFVASTTPVTNIALSLIAFAIGGSLSYTKIKRLGKGILYITPLEAEFAFLAVIIGILIVAPFYGQASTSSWVVRYVPLALLIASLASATDPSATYAVAEEYKAKGSVISTVLGVAALDDVLGIINFSLAVVISQTIISHQGFTFFNIVGKPLLNIFGAIFLGAAFGFLFNVISYLIKRETEGVFIVVIIGMLALAFGFADFIGVDPLLTTMTMGTIVVNFNRYQEKLFQMLSRYTDELVFVLFFTLCGMQLEFHIFLKCLLMILIFALFRFAGKFAGTFLGASLAKSNPKVKKYTAGGLVPQGGIIVGLALMLKQNPIFDTGNIADIVISIIIGSTVIHELLGPIFVKITLKKAGEI